MRTIQYLLLAGLLTITPSLADSSNTDVQLKCAARDAHFQLQLEHYGEQGNMPGEQLYAAFRTMLGARTACADGRFEEGLKLYDSAFGPAHTIIATD